VAQAIGKSQGGYYKLATANTTDGKRALSVPWAIIGAMISYRKSWFEEVGYNEFPKTWQEYHDAGKKLKAKGRPIGQTLGHTFGDAPTFSYPLLWSFGGKEVDEKGKVVLDSKETLESVKFMTEFWKDAHDEGGLAWDDTNNNRAFLSGTIAATLNGASIYIETLRKPDQYKTEKDAPMNKDIRHSPLPKGPAGQYGFHLFQSHMLMKYSKNQKAAKEFLKWIHTPANYEKWFVSQKGYSTPPSTQWEKHKMWDEDPVLAPFKIAGRLGLTPGYAGPPNRKSAEVLTKYIITDMYAKAVQGMSPQEAVKWAAGEVQKVYSGA
jgi:multiple sugar transport system substrate-binding protein